MSTPSDSSGQYSDPQDSSLNEEVIINDDGTFEFLPGGSKASSGKTPSNKGVVGQLSETFNNEINSLADQGKQVFVEVGKEAVREGVNQLVKVVTKSVTKGSGRTRSGPKVDVPSGGGGDFDDPGSNDTGGDQDIHMCNTRPPLEERLVTGIIPRSYTPDLEFAYPNLSAPLHLSLGYIQIPTDNLYYASKFYSTAIYNDWLTKVQSAIGFQLPSIITSGGSVPNDNLTSYFNTLLMALQVYYFFDGLFQSKSSPGVFNEGLRSLSNSLTATDYSNYLILERTLRSQPIPPNMRQLCHYLYQHFRSSSLPASPVTKICPVGFTNYLTGLDTSPLSTWNANLTTLTNMQIASVLRSACPEWIPQDWFHIPPGTVHDNNFSTIYANLAVIGTNTAAGSVYNFKGPGVNDMVSDIPYNSYTNQLDGLAYAMACVWNNTSAKWVPGIFVPFAVNSSSTSTTNRVSYFNSGSGSSFVDVYMQPYTALVTNRGETLCYNYQFNDSVQNYGSQIVFGVNGNSVSQTAAAIIDWILDPTIIRSLDTKRYGRSNKNKGKDKG